MSYHYTPEAGGPKFNLHSEADAFWIASTAWENDAPGSTIKFGGSSLERTAGSAGRNPYLVIRVERELINDHNDIDDPRIGSFVRQLILMTSQTSRLENRGQTRSKSLDN